MSDNIIQLNQEIIHNELKDLVRNSVEETLNALLDHEAEQLVNAARNAKAIVPDTTSATSRLPRAKWN